TVPGAPKAVEAWEEVRDTRAAWTSGVRVAVDFADEFPDNVHTLLGLQPSQPRAAVERIEAKYTGLAETRMLDTSALLGAAVKDGVPHLATEGKGPSEDLGARTRFFAIEERAAAMIQPAPAVAAAAAVVPPAPRVPRLSVPRLGKVFGHARSRFVLYAALSLCAVALLAARWGMAKRALRAPTPRAAPASSASAAPASLKSALAPPSLSAVSEPIAAADAQPVAATGAHPFAVTAARPVAEPEVMNPPSANPAERTLERRAADAVETGDIPQAAILYDELVHEHPESAVYREASHMVHAQKSASRSPRAAR
ncbi:MAG TPA: hypothetical protein VGL13_12615, partial [Polyangiaceae bacterium]